MGAQFIGCLVRRQGQGCTQERGTAPTRCAVSVQPQPWCLGCSTAGVGCSSSLTQSFPQGTSPFQQESGSVWLPFVAGVTICVCEASSGSQPWLCLPRLQCAQLQESQKGTGAKQGMRQNKRNRNQHSEHFSLREQHRQGPSQHPSTTNTHFITKVFFALAFTASSAPRSLPNGTGRSREGLLQQASKNRKRKKKKNNKR